jgi:hypothetical protein
MPNKQDDERGTFAGPGYGGFGGSAGYTGSGIGGVSGAYTGSGYEGGPVNTGEPWRPAPDTVHDDAIARDVKARLEQAEDVDANEVYVDVEAGVVTLSGHVATRAMRHAALEHAERVPGVHGVHNQIHADQPLLDALAERIAHIGNKML